MRFSSSSGRGGRRNDSRRDNDRRSSNRRSNTKRKRSADNEFLISLSEPKRSKYGDGEYCTLRFKCGEDAVNVYLSVNQYGAFKILEIDEAQELVAEIAAMVSGDSEPKRNAPRRGSVNDLRKKYRNERDEDRDDEYDDDDDNDEELEDDNNDDDDELPF